MRTVWHWCTCITPPQRSQWRFTSDSIAPEVIVKRILLSVSTGFGSSVTEKPEFSLARKQTGSQGIALQ
jgi:hypothetical protein